MKPRIIFVLGAPGSGKSTQCAQIVKEFGLTHISAGEALREECKKPESIYSKEIKSCFDNKAIVPSEITCAVIENKMKQMQNNKNLYLVDAFPINMDNLNYWNDKMKDKIDLQFILALKCHQSVCVERCLNRNMGRFDDNIEHLKNRFEIFFKQSLPVIEHYRANNLVREIDCNASDPDEIYENIKKALNELNIS